MTIKPKKIAKNERRVEEFIAQMSQLRLKTNIPSQGWIIGQENIIVEPGEVIPTRILERFGIDPAIIHPDSLRNKASFEFAHRNKRQFSVGIIRDMNGRGDVLMASVIAKALKDKYGNDVTIWYVVQPGYERILKYNPWIDRIFNDRAEMKALKPDIVYNVNNLEFKAELREYKELGRVNRNRATIYLHNMDLYVENKTPIYIVTPEEREWARAELKRRGYDLEKSIIGLELEGSNVTRTYPYMQKVGELLAKENFQILYLDEKKNDKYMYNMEQIGALVEQMFTVITPNSYFYHLVGAMQKRGTAIFGSCDGDVWTEDYEKVNVVQIDCPLKGICKRITKCWWELRCLPGDSLSEKEMTTAPACLNQITPEMVVDKVGEHFRTKKVLVVVLTYELLDLTRQMLDSIRSFHNCDLLIIDNESTDGTVEYMERKGIECISKKMTVPEAWNRGMLEAYNRGYDYVLLCNNDLILAPNYIDTVVECAERRQAPAVTGKVINKGQCTQSEFATMIEPVEYTVNVMSAGDYSALLLSRKCIKDIGAFRVFGKRYQADEDHLLRLRLSGYDLTKTHGSAFYHLLGAVVHTLPDEVADKEADWQRGVDAFQRYWNFCPYGDRTQLGSIVFVKERNPDWKKKIKNPIKGLK